VSTARRLLLDTHVFLWRGEPSRLKDQAFLTGYWFDRAREHAARQRGEVFDRLKYAMPQSLTFAKGRSSRRCRPKRSLEWRKRGSETPGGGRQGVTTSYRCLAPIPPGTQSQSAGAQFGGTYSERALTARLRQTP
jgi:hypothetical protein